MIWMQEFFSTCGIIFPKRNCSFFFQIKFMWIVCLDDEFGKHLKHEWKMVL